MVIVTVMTKKVFVKHCGERGKIRTGGENKGKVKSKKYGVQLKDFNNS